MLEASSVFSTQKKTERAYFGLKDVFSRKQITEPL